MMKRMARSKSPEIQQKRYKVVINVQTYASFTEIAHWSPNFRPRSSYLLCAESSARSKWCARWRENQSHPIFFNLRKFASAYSVILKTGAWEVGFGQPGFTSPATDVPSKFRASSSCYGPLWQNNSALLPVVLTSKFQANSRIGPVARDTRCQKSHSFFSEIHGFESSLFLEKLWKRTLSPDPCWVTFGELYPQNWIVKKNGVAPILPPPSTSFRSRRDRCTQKISASRTLFWALTDDFRENHVFLDVYYDFVLLLLDFMRFWPHHRLRQTLLCI